MSFTKTNPWAVDQAVTITKLGQGWENGQLAARLLCAGITSSAAIANTTTETAFNKKFAMPANTIDRVGSVLVVRAIGLFSVTGTPTLRLRAKLGSATIIDSAINTMASGATDFPWQMEGHLIVRSLGSGSQARMGGSHYVRGTLGAASPLWGLWDNTNLITADFTIANDITFTAQWGTASVSNTIKMDGFYVYVMPPETTVS